MTDSDANVMQSILKAAETGEAEKGLPPVESWEPESCGTMDLVIRRDGSWWHEGRRMTRQRLVHLFSRVLRKDADGKIYLVTPIEKIEITVEAAPFLIVRVDRVDTDDGQAVVCTTNFGDHVAIGPDHPLRIDLQDDGQPDPYVLVRGRLEGLFTRSAFYDLVDMAEIQSDEKGVDQLVLRSHGQDFSLGAVSE